MIADHRSEEDTFAESPGTGVSTVRRSCGSWVRELESMQCKKVRSRPSFSSK